MSFRQFVHTEGGKGSKGAVIGAAVVAAGMCPSNADIHADLSKLRGMCCTDLNSKYRELSKHHHPDKGGCEKNFVALTNAKEAAKLTCSKNTCLPKKHHHKGYKKPSTSSKKDAKRRRKRQRVEERQRAAKRKEQEERIKKRKEQEERVKKRQKAKKRQGRKRKERKKRKEREEREKRNDKILGVAGGVLLVGGVVASRQQKDQRRRHPLRQNSEEAYEHATGHKRQYKN